MTCLVPIQLEFASYFSVMILAEVPLPPPTELPPDPPLPVPPPSRDPPLAPPPPITRLASIAPALPVTCTSGGGNEAGVNAHAPSPITISSSSSENSSSPSKPERIEAPEVSSLSLSQRLLNIADYNSDQEQMSPSKPATRWVRDPFAVGAGVTVPPPGETDAEAAPKVAPPPLLPPGGESDGGSSSSTPEGDSDDDDIAMTAMRAQLILGMKRRQERKIQQLDVSVRACVCVCVCARTRVCVCLCVCGLILGMRRCQVCEIQREFRGVCARVCDVFRGTDILLIQTRIFRKSLFRNVVPANACVQQNDCPNPHKLQKMG